MRIYTNLPDFLLEKLQKNYDLTRVKSIGGAAQVGYNFWIIEEQ